MAACGTCSTIGRKPSRLGQNTGGGSKINPKDIIQWLLLGGVAFGLYKVFGPEAEPGPIDEYPVPGGKENLPPGWDPQPMAKNLKLVMEGAAFTFEQIAFRNFILTAYLQIADPLFVDVYNYFNKNYAGGQSLKEWIKEEVGLGVLGDQIIVRFNSFSPRMKGVSGWLYTPGIDPARQFFNWNPLIWKQQYKQITNDLNNDLDALVPV